MPDHRDQETDLEPHVLAECDRRRLVVPGKVMNRDLSRYYEALARARAHLRQRLTTAELSAVLDVLNGHWFSDASSVDVLYAEVEDAVRLNGLDRKWGIDGPALVHKLTQCNYITLCALADAAERWWSKVGAGQHDLDPATALDEEETPDAG